MIYNKYKNTKISQIYEVILQWYLIIKGLRDVALVNLDNLHKSKLRKIRIFLEKNNISYRIFIKKSYLVLFNPRKFNINNLDKTFGKKFGQQLGKFYYCATNDVSKNHYRIVITVNEVEIFAQMCKKNMIKKNISKYYNIYLRIIEIFRKLDKNIFSKLETYKVPHQ